MRYIYCNFQLYVDQNLNITSDSNSNYVYLSKFITIMKKPLYLILIVSILLSGCDKEKEAIIFNNQIP